MEAAGDKSMISIDEQFVHNSVSRSRSPIKKRFGDNSDINMISNTKNLKTSISKSQLSSRKSSKVKRAKTPFDTTMIVDGHLMPIRVNKRNGNASQFRTQQKLKKKAKKNKAIWSKRETDWFKFERR